MRNIKKMRLLGVFSVLDIAVIAFILLIAVPMVYYYVKLNEKGAVEQRLLEKFLKRQAMHNVGFQSGPQEARIDVLVSFKNLTDESLDKIKVGDKETLPDGTVLAEVLWLGESVPNYFLVNLGNDADGIIRKTVGDGTRSLPAKVRLYGIVEDYGDFSYKDKKVKQLRHYTFDNGSFEADFVVEVAK
ncbi:MAG: hypothetical protein ABH885_06505 [Candidatus Omnitrophota bacterium]